MCMHKGPTLMVIGQALPYVLSLHCNLSLLSGENNINLECLHGEEIHGWPHYCHLIPVVW
jgi:hypothetical protein